MGNSALAPPRAVVLSWRCSGEKECVSGSGIISDIPRAGSQFAVGAINMWSPCDWACGNFEFLPGDVVKFEAVLTGIEEFPLVVSSLTVERSGDIKRDVEQNGVPLDFGFDFDRYHRHCAWDVATHAHNCRNLFSNSPVFDLFFKGKKVNWRGVFRRAREENKVLIVAVPMQSWSRQFDVNLEMQCQMPGILTLGDFINFKGTIVGQEGAFVYHRIKVFHVELAQACLDGEICPEKSASQIGSGTDGSWSSSGCAQASCSGTTRPTNTSNCNSGDPQAHCCRANGPLTVLNPKSAASSMHGESLRLFKWDSVRAMASKLCMGNEQAAFPHRLLQLNLLIRYRLDGNLQIHTGLIIQSNREVSISWDNGRSWDGLIVHMVVSDDGFTELQFQPCNELAWAGVRLAKSVMYSTNFPDETSPSICINCGFISSESLHTLAQVMHEDVRKPLKPKTVYSWETDCTIFVQRLLRSVGRLPSKQQIQQAIPDVLSLEESVSRQVIARLTGQE